MSIFLHISCLIALQSALTEAENGPAICLQPSLLQAGGFFGERGRGTSSPHLHIPGAAGTGQVQHSEVVAAAVGGQPPASGAGMRVPLGSQACHSARRVGCPVQPHGSPALARSPASLPGEESGQVEAGLLPPARERPLRCQDAGAATSHWVLKAIRGPGWLHCVPQTAQLQEADSDPNPQ